MNEMPGTSGLGDHGRVWEESLCGARVVVTGGAGFVGSWVSERLLDAGAQVWIVDNLLTGSADKIEHLCGRPGFAITLADASHSIPDPGGVDVGVARLFNTYGPRMSLDDGRVVPAFLNQALSGAPLTVAGDGSQTRSLCWVEDTVEGLLRLACADVAGPVNIGSDHEVTVLELARTVIELTASESRIHHVALPADDPHVRRPDLTRARLLLGWEPEMPLEEGLKRTALWMEETRSTAPPWNLSCRAASPRVLAGTDME